MRQFIVGSYAPEGAPSIFGILLHDDRLECVWENREAINPSYLFLHPNGQVLYAAEERIPDGRLAIFRKDGEQWSLCERLTAGSAPCHIAMSKDSRFLYISNYMDGSISVYGVDENGLNAFSVEKLQHHGKSVHPIRQSSPHMHSCLCADELVYASDLGLDRIFVYQEIESSLRKVRDIALPAGCGVRHMAVSDDFPELLYANAELSGDVFVIHRKSGKVLQTLSAVHEGDVGFGTSAIKIDGNKICVATRERDQVAFFTILNDGFLHRDHLFDLPRSFPRDLWFQDSLLMTANQGTCSLSLYSLKNDSLNSLHTLSTDSAHPSCILLLEQ